MQTNISLILFPFNALNNQKLFVLLKLNPLPFSFTLTISFLGCLSSSLSLLSFTSKQGWNYKLEQTPLQLIHNE